MKRLLLVFSLLPHLVFSQYNAKCFFLEKDRGAIDVNVGKIFTQDTTMELSIKGNISGFSISGNVVLNSRRKSYVRVLLRDQFNYDYLVYESYYLLADAKESSFRDIGIETTMLDNITPKSLFVELKNASICIDSYCYLNSSASEKFAKDVDNKQKEQTQYIVNRLNDNLRKHNKTWRAGVTSISELSYEEKKAMFGGSLPQLYGFEYYKGGIFVMPEVEEETNHNMGQTRNNQYVTSWDWRERHGKNWMTSVKKQGNCKSCWAFATLGTIEAYTNLYYNQLLNYDLSEQELVSCTGIGCNKGSLYDAFDYIEHNGVVNEDCFQYDATALDCSSKCNNPDDIISLKGHDTLFVFNMREDSLKHRLFRSPIAFGLFSWQHGVVFAGFKTITGGDSIYLKKDSVVVVNYGHELIGQTAWLIKNSWGNWGDNGYGYVVTALPADHALVPTGKITSIIYNDSNIICEDADGDGLYFWGIGPKPANCPSWVPDTPDGDDSNINYGSLDSYGNLDALPAGITIKTPVTYSSNSSTSYRLGIVNGGSLTVTGTTTLTGNSKIRICEGGVLIVDGGTINNADITMIPGSQLIVRNNGKIYMAFGTEFVAPKGAIVNIESGEIQ